MNAPQAPLPALDAIDHRILEILRKDGRITWQALSEKVHLTPRPCQERVRKLERAGIITGYHERVAPSAAHFDGLRARRLSTMVAFLPEALRFPCRPRPTS